MTAAPGTGPNRAAAGGKQADVPVIFERPLADIQAALKAITGTLAAHTAALTNITRTLEKIMSEDAAVLAVVTDEEAQVTALGASVTALQGLVTALQAQPPASLQPSTLAALQAAQASLDTLATTGAADVSAA